jgi:hypothetical protein
VLYDALARGADGPPHQSVATPRTSADAIESMVVIITRIIYDQTFYVPFVQTAVALPSTFLQGPDPGGTKYETTAIGV